MLDRQIHFANDAVVVEIQDEVDMANVADLERALREAETLADPSTRIVLSFEKCTYCDSTAIQFVLRTWRRLGARFFVVIPPDTACFRVFAITAIDTMSFVVRSVAQALSRT